ncbi:MAG: dihydrofolate reductase [Muribaculaceae bacterium]|nr:dihydrofolate reductase [Muribaculaceae bacterium]
MNLIVAIDRKGAIGRRGELLYHISADLRRFKALTTGHTVVMGRKTFESLPKGALPNRRNIVVSRSSGYSAPGVEVAHSLEAAVAMADSKDIYIIGGAEIYRQALPLVDRLLLTVIDAETADADTFFPALPLDEFSIERIEPHDGFRFIDMTRKPTDNE